MIKDNEYDAVVLDVMLPVLDGFEVCRLVRAFSEVPIIMVTARPSPYHPLPALRLP